MAGLAFFRATEELSQQGNGHTEEVAALQKSIAALDREKDALQDEVDQKTEKVVALQEENSKKVHMSGGGQVGISARPESALVIMSSIVQAMERAAPEQFPMYTV